MSNVQPADENLGQAISTAAYNAERLQPQPGQYLYLHLSDLRRTLESVRTEASITLLDYGCGGSPYAELFPNAVYKRADYLQTGELDYVLGSDSRVPEQDGVFDTILSTQVLEHVERPEIYLSECHRLLKPGGEVILTTHGTFPEHGCPYDYQRWTADGLRIAFEKSGFRVMTQRKLTCGPRALFFLADIFSGWLRAPHTTLFGLGLKLVRAILNRLKTGVHRACDQHFAAYREVEPGSPADCAFYIALFVVARKV